MSKPRREADLSRREVPAAMLTTGRMLRHDLGNTTNIIIGYVDLLRIGDAGALPVAAESVLPAIWRSAHDMAAKIHEISVVRDGDRDPAGPIARLRSAVDGPFGDEMSAAAFRVLHLVGLAVAALRDAAPDGAEGDAAECFLAIENAARRVLQVIEQHQTARRDALRHAMPVVRLDDSAPPMAALDGARAPDREVTATAGVRVLVVDDERENVELLSRWLTRLGYAVTTADNGRDAVQMARIGNWDAVLLDIVMPEMDGVEVLRAIKADPAMRRIPVIMVSAYADTGRLAACLDAGADDFLSKPVDPSVLRARVRSSVLRKRHADAERQRQLELRLEQDRSDQLLQAIFPAHIVDAMRQRGHVAPRRHEQVAVIFCDIQDFGRYCAHHAPEVVIGYLDDLYRRLEAVCTAHHVEKIKTVGDGFIAAAGLDHRTPDPAMTALRCALDFLDAAAASLAGWQVRIGVALGPVVAGVVGASRFGFDLFGDTVHCAARIEALAHPGEVWCCERTREGVRRAIPLAFAGTLTPRGKRRLKLYRVIAGAPDACTMEGDDERG